jgi:hypothetical protein
MGGLTCIRRGRVWALAEDVTVRPGPPDGKPRQRTNQAVAEVLQWDSSARQITIC